MSAVNTEELRRLAQRLGMLAADLKAEITLGTREEWNAWELLDRAARDVFSAAGTLELDAYLARREGPT